MTNILWLCSWYPHPGDPYEGDFIQRHAKALGIYTPVTVIYVSQAGVSENTDKKLIEQNDEGIKEQIVFFHFKKTGIKFLDKLIYNYRYFQSYKKIIKSYITKEGKPDIVHIHVPMKAGMIGRWIKKKWGIDYILSEHSSHYNGQTDDDFLSKNYLHRYQVKKVFTGASVVTNVSVAIAGKLKELFGIADVRIIRNTVDTRLFYFATIKIEKFRFIHVSTLANYQKNIDGILAALSLLAAQRQDFEFVFVGPASENLKLKVARSTLSSFVKFTGEISYPEVARQMQQSSALVLFSRYENFPCVMIEALCCGLPVISSDTGGIREAITDTNGILVESGNEEQLKVAMQKMMEVFKIFNREMIAAEAVQRYSYETIGKEFADLYEELISRKS